jgi:hypothetical protein
MLRRGCLSLGIAGVNYLVHQFTPHLSAPDVPMGGSLLLLNACVFDLDRPWRIHNRSSQNQHDA